MAAIAYPVPERSKGTRPRLVSLPAGRAAPPSRAALYRRRRAMALALVTLIAVLTAVSIMALRGALTGPGGDPLAATGPVGAVQPAAAHIHVVQPGETLWSIVRSQGRAGDPRPLVDRLAGQTGGRPLQVGQRLVLP